MAMEYKLNIECSDLQIELLLNGFPVFSQIGGMHSKSAIFNQWLVDGRNGIQLLINTVEKNSPIADSAHVTLDLSFNEETIHNFTWNSSDSARPLPHVSRGEFVSENGFGVWAWQRGELLELNQKIIDEINRFVQRVHTALSTANLTETMTLFRVKAEEQAIAYEMPIAERINQQRNFFEEWFGQPEWRMDRLDYERFEYALYAGNRVVRVRYKDGAEVLQSKEVSDGEMISFPLFISKINGQWIVVR